MIKRKKRSILFLMCIFLLALSLPVHAAKPKLNLSKKTVYVGRSFQLKVLHTRKKVKWTSNNKGIVAITGSGKVKTKKTGSSIIIARVGSKSLKCVVKVKPYSLFQMEKKVNQYFQKHKPGWFVSHDMKPEKKSGNYYYFIRTKNGNSANILIGRLVVNFKTGIGKLDYYGSTLRYKFV